MRIQNFYLSTEVLEFIKISKTPFIQSFKNLCYSIKLARQRPKNRLQVARKSRENSDFKLYCFIVCFIIRINNKRLLVNNLKINPNLARNIIHC